MSEAVLVHEVYKKFENPHIPLWMRGTRRSQWASHTTDAMVGQPVVVAVQDVSFAILPGEIFGIVGPSGSGKSTLIRLISTLLMPDEGQIRVFNHDVVRHPAQARQLINPVSLQTSFFKRLSPLENLLHGANGIHVHERSARQEGIRLLLSLGLDEHGINQPMEALPRSLQMVVAVARALLSRPRLLLLDDPTVGLDEFFKHKVRDALRELRDQTSATILLATRDVQEAGQLCDRVAFLVEGRLAGLVEPRLIVLN